MNNTSYLSFLLKSASACFLTIILLIGIHAPVQAQSETELQKLYSDFLDKKGLFSKIDSDGDVQFKYGNNTYFIEVNEDDPGFFRLVMPNIWPIESEAERAKVLKAMDVANSQVKVAKIYTVRDDVWVGVEGFVDNPDDYEAYFDRCINVIKLTIEKFKSAMS